MNQTTTHVDVAGVSVAFHCNHVDGIESYRVVHDTIGVTVYLSGTPDELMLFALAIANGVRNHAIAVTEAAINEANEALR